MSKNKGLRSVITREYLQREYLEKGRTASDIGKEHDKLHAKLRWKSGAFRAL